MRLPFINLQIELEICSNTYQLVVIYLHASHCRCSAVRHRQLIVRAELLIDISIANVPSLTQPSIR